MKDINLIVDNRTIKEFGQPPQKVKDLAELALNHGKSFSQGDYCICVKFIKELKSWAIVDNYGRGIHKSILYEVDSKTFYAYTEKSSQKALYSKKITPLNHAKQFFMPGIAGSLFKGNT